MWIRTGSIIGRENLIIEMEIWVISEKKKLFSSKDSKEEGREIAVGGRRKEDFCAKTSKNSCAWKPGALMLL